MLWQRRYRHSSEPQQLRTWQSYVLSLGCNHAITTNDNDHCKCQLYNSKCNSHCCKHVLLQKLKMHRWSCTQSQWHKAMHVPSTRTLDGAYTIMIYVNHIMYTHCGLCSTASCELVCNCNRCWRSVGSTQMRRAPLMNSLSRWSVPSFPNQSAAQLQYV